MKLRTLVLAIIALLPLLSCGNGAVSAQLDDIESYIQDRPDSALVAIVAIDTNSLNTRALAAKYSLLYAMALDKNYIDTTDLSIIEPAVNYYRRHGSADEKLKVLYYQGRVHFNARDYNKAIVSFSEALPLVEKTTDNKYDGMLYSAIAASYNLNFAIDECIEFSKKAYESFSVAGEKDLANWALYSQAQDYSNMRKYALADSLYKALLSVDDLNVSLRSNIESSYAFMITNRGIRWDLPVADSLFRSAIAHSGSLNNDANWGAYAYALSMNGRFEEAESILRSLYAANSPRYDYWAGRVAEQKGDYKNASTHLFSTLTQLDSTVNNALRQSTIKSQRDFFEEQNLLLKARSDNMTLLMILIILGVCLILFIVFYAVKQKIKQAKDEKTRLVEIIKTSNVQMNYYKERYEDERISIQKEFRNQYREQFQYLNAIGEAMVDANNSKAPANHVYRAIKKMLKDIGKDESGQTKFEDMVDDRMDGIISLFKKDFPNLKEKDYRFITYFFAGFNANLISILTDYPSLPAVYTRKSRMRAMIEESSSQYKELYLEMIS